MNKQNIFRKIIAFSLAAVTAFAVLPSTGGGGT